MSSGAVTSVLALTTGPCTLAGCGVPVLPVVGLAFTGLSSGTLTLFSTLSRISIAVVLSLVLISCGSQANVKPNGLFADNCVLQRGVQVPVWGTADPDEEVSVSIGGNSASTKAGTDGKWSVKLKEMSAGGPHELVIKGKNEIKLTDVLIGEVWVASGQSNPTPAARSCMRIGS